MPEQWAGCPVLGGSTLAAMTTCSPSPAVFIVRMRGCGNLGSRALIHAHEQICMRSVALLHVCSGTYGVVSEGGS